MTAAAPSTQLFPGGSADVALTISNPNPFVLHVGALTLDTTQGAGGFAVDATHGSCGLSSLSFATQTNGGAGWSVPARVGGTDGTLALDLPNAASMTAGAPGACQGASFTIYLAGGP